MRAVLAGEWTKVATLRATVWTLLPTVAAGAGLAVLVSASLRSASAAGWAEQPDPIFAVVYGLTLAQLPLVVFGVLLVGSEYSSGTIRAALLATPQRGRLYAGKLLVGGLVAAGVALVTVAAAALAGRAALGPYRVGLGDAGVARALVGGWLYLTLICLFAVGVTAMLRSAVIALAVLLPVLFLGSQGLGNIPRVRTVTQFLPDSAGTLILGLAGPPDDPVFDRVYGPWGGVGILALWVAAAVLGGFLLLRRRDA